MLGPVVHLNVDALLTIRTLQSTFLQSFAMEQGETAVNTVSHWMLNGVMLTTKDALDLVRVAPEFLTLIRPHKPGLASKSESLVAKAFSQFSNLKLSPDASPNQRPEKLSWVISVSEAIEIATYVHSAADTLLRHQVPEPGRPKMFQAVWQAHPGPLATQHRLDSHALYLVITGSLHVEPSRFSANPMLSGRMESALYLQEDGIVDGDWKGTFIDITDPRMNLGMDTRRIWDDYIRKVTTGATGQFLSKTSIGIDTTFEPVGIGVQQRVVDLTLNTMRPLLNKANERVRVL